MSASWSHEATAPAPRFRDQYCARARHGLLRLGFFLSSGETLENLSNLLKIESVSNRFRIGFKSIVACVCNYFLLAHHQHKCVVYRVGCNCSKRGIWRIFIFNCFAPKIWFRKCCLGQHTDGFFFAVNL